MINSKNLLLTAVLLSITSLSFGQIITSKKEAVKKGVYQKPEDKKKESEAMASLSKKTETAVAYQEVKQPEVKSTTKGTPKPKKYSIDKSEPDDKDLLISPPENYLAMQMINNAMEFLGVRYRGGGTTTAGMDCSGMVTAVFDIFDLKLPRSSHEMATVGEKIDEKEAKKGDLIFFKTSRRGISHVGIITEVTDDNEIKFIHSSTSQGVVVSSMNEAYYKKTFVQINRVLQ
ncbi:cell wall-associated NlpC family hydrolase [Flavobacterium arsenatis]|uniref:Cell wall-associated NlpC family hydrolase n=1 Tax=Flavobacterium arsenatis TaxID=1484332 RepID=A0ABU1TKL2_9FLAO|nr:C40 family peptidase [Flavobacterium arsenatis]MDR6966386.1 cell wall-associated NlpC family hydrolase [Flavobacterium arsenatis]